MTHETPCTCALLTNSILSLYGSNPYLALSAAHGHREQNLTSLHDSIRQRFQLGPAVHMTHVDNLASIITAGGLRSHSQMTNFPYADLSNEDVQTGRATIVVPTSQRPLHDYVPLFFGFKTPMVAWNQARNDQMIFLRVSLDILVHPNLVFTDGNARSKTTQFFDFTGPDDLAVINAKAINTVKYAKDAELKRQKQAEILIPDFLSFDKVLDIICFSSGTRTQILAILDKFAIKRQVTVNTGWYFLPSVTDI